MRVKEMAGQSALQKESVVTMPADGLVWTISGKPGEQMDANHLVMEVINPSHIWVDAFFAERQRQRVAAGSAGVDLVARQHRAVARFAGVRARGRGAAGV